MKKSFVARFSSMVLCICMILSIMPALDVFAAITPSDDDYFKVVSQKNYAISPGVTEATVIMNNDEGTNQNVLHVIDVDLTNSKVGVMGTYSNMDTSVWVQQPMSQQAAAVESKFGVNVVGAINTNLSWASDEPIGVLVVNGEVWHEEYTSSYDYLAIDRNGKAEIRKGTEKLHGDEWVAVNGFTIVVKDGKNLQAKTHAIQDRAPRTCIGIKEDGTLVLCVIDGRQAPYSSGMSLYEMGEVMMGMGCVDVLNCDGGGSSTFLSEREGTGELVINNSPSDGQERPTLGGLVVISYAAPDGVFDHAVVEPDQEYFMPKSEIAFTATGVDASGGVAELPEGLVWALSDDTADMGTIDPETGVFKAADGKLGTVTAQILQDGEVVGEADVEIVIPTSIGFGAEEVSLDFDETTDLVIVAKYNGLDVNFTAADFDFKLDNSALGTLDGLTFTSCESGSLNGYLTMTSVHDASLTATLKLIVGMLPTVVWDFEDIVDPVTGEVIAAEDYYVNGYTAADGTEIAGILNHANYSRGGKESIEIVSIDDQEAVRFGSKSLKLNYDFTNCGAVTEGAIIGTSEAMTIPGRPTAIGCWVYAPEGVGIQWGGEGTQAGLWLRGYVRLPDGSTGQYDFTLEPKAVTPEMFANGVMPGIYWEGWKYCEADLTKYKDVAGSFALMSGNTFRLMFVNGTKMGTRTAGSIYFDNLQFVYGTNVDDTENPEVNHITNMNTGEELATGAVINSNKVSFSADFFDIINKYTTGIDTSTLRIYIDGVNTYGDDSFNFVINEMEEKCFLYDVTLLDGEHSITVSARDKAGNEVSETRYFTVDGSDDLSDLPVLTFAPENDFISLGRGVNLTLKASNAADVKTVVFGIKIDRNFPDYSVAFSDMYEGTTSYNKLSRILTVTATRKEDAPMARAADANAIASIYVEAPTTLKEGSVLGFELDSARYETADGKILTYSLHDQEIPVSVDYEIHVDPVLVGTTATVTVTNTVEGGNVANVSVYLENGKLLGTTDENGIFTTDVFGKQAAQYVIYAKDAEGGLSFNYNVGSFVAVGENNEPFAIMNTASGDGSTQKTISWMSNPLLAGEQKLQYAIGNTGRWVTVDAETMLCTFVSGDRLAVNANHVDITGLKPNTTYSFRVGNSEAWSDTYYFKTNDAGKSTSFFVFGDIQAEDLTNINNILKLVNAKDYGFGLQTGDAVDDASNYKYWEEIAMLTDISNLGTTDMIRVLGNHEFSGDADGLYANTIYGVPTTGMGGTYSVTYGNVYVAVINYTADKIQLQNALDWLEKDASASDADWKVLSIHQPAYYTNVSGGNQEIHDMLPPVVDKLGIDLVFSGHDHTYARTEPLKGGVVDPDGAVYFICGSSGEKSYTVTENEDFHFVKATQEYDAIYLDVESTRTSIKVTVYNVLPDGTAEVFDSYEKKIPACENDEHSYVYNKKDDILSCTVCRYECSAAESMYFGWAEGANGEGTYSFAGGKCMTGYNYMEQTPLFFTEDGIAYDGEYTIIGETCYFEDGKYVSCSTADVLAAGWCGDDIAFILYANGDMFIKGNGDMYTYEAYGTTPWRAYKESIRRVTFSDGITSIGHNAFHQAFGILEVNFGKNSKLEYIDKAAFYYCWNIKEIRIPAGVKKIDHSAFGYCRKLTVYMPSDIEYIHSMTFRDPQGYIIVDVLEGSYAESFAKNAGIEYVTREDDYINKGEITSNVDWTLYEDGTLKVTGNGVIPAYTASTAPWSSVKSKVKALVIGAGITEIGEGAFSYLSNLASVTFEEGSKIETIAKGTFMYCKKLQTITLPESVKVIGDRAFANCYSLINIELSANVTEIHTNAFYRRSTKLVITAEEGSVAYAYAESKGIKH